MLSAYPACFFKEETGYSVIFPDLGHLATCGDTLEEALAMAVDCLAGYLYFSRHDNVSSPSSMESIDLSLIADDLGISADGAFVNMVTVDVEEYAIANFEKSVRKNLTIPAWLNTAALEQNINFSKVLQDALVELLTKEKV